MQPKFHGTERAKRLLAGSEAEPLWSVGNLSVYLRGQGERSMGCASAFQRASGEWG